MPIGSRVLTALSARCRPTIRRCATVVAARWTTPGTDADEVLAFVERQHGRMNEVLALGTNALALAFRAEVCARARACFADASDAVVAEVQERWRGSRIGRLRDFVRFVESLVSYAALALDAGERPDALEAVA